MRFVGSCSDLLVLLLVRDTFADCPSVGMVSLPPVIESLSQSHPTLHLVPCYLNIIFDCSVGCTALAEGPSRYILRSRDWRRDLSEDRECRMSSFRPLVYKISHALCFPLPQSCFPSDPQIS
jgi:hypothetical protein